MKSTVLSLAVLALLGETDAVRLVKQNKVLYADDFAATGEHDLAQEQPKKPEAAKTSLHQHPVYAFGDTDSESDLGESVIEKEDTRNEVEAAKRKLADDLLKPNEFDGLIHLPSGQLVDPNDGTEVKASLGQVKSRGRLHHKEVDPNDETL